MHELGPITAENFRELRRDFQQRLVCSRPRSVRRVTKFVTSLLPRRWGGSVKMGAGMGDVLWLRRLYGKRLRRHLKAA